MNVSKYKIFLLISLNLGMQISAFCLIKYAWIHAQHSIFNIFNYVTILAFSFTFIRAFLWQRLLSINGLISSYLPNAILPSLLLFAGYFLFNEHITIYNVTGSFIILIGLAVLFMNKVDV